MTNLVELISNIVEHLPDYWGFLVAPTYIGLGILNVWIWNYLSKPVCNKEQNLTKGDMMFHLMFLPSIIPGIVGLLLAVLFNSIYSITIWLFTKLSKCLPKPTIKDSSTRYDFW